MALSMYAQEVRQKWPEVDQSDLDALADGDKMAVVARTKDGTLEIEYEPRLGMYLVERF
jgi:hypothetical protein